MRAIKNVFIIIFVALVITLLAQSYVVISLNDRAIILGMGIDYVDESYEITCEVIGQSNASSETGSAFNSQMISGKGKTISLAVHDVYTKTGKLPSLGQCCILILGKSLYKTENIQQCLAYFSFSDAFKDGTLVACAINDAKEIFNVTTPLDSSISFALQGIIQGSENNTAIKQNWLSNFVSKQLTLSSSSYLSVIEFNVDENSMSEQANPKKLNGFFNAQKVAVFHNYDYVGVLDDQEKKGFSLMANSKAFDTFVVYDPNNSQVLPQIVGLGVETKNVSFSPKFSENEQPSLEIKINMSLKRLRTDTTGHVLEFLPITPVEISENMIDQVKKETQTVVIKAIDYAKVNRCDYLEINNKFYKQFGKKWVEYANESSNVLEKINYKIIVDISI